MGCLPTLWFCAPSGHSCCPTINRLFFHPHEHSELLGGTAPLARDPDLIHLHCSVDQAAVSPVMLANSAWSGQHPTPHPHTSPSSKGSMHLLSAWTKRDNLSTPFPQTPQMQITRDTSLQDRGAHCQHLLAQGKGKTFHIQGQHKLAQAQNHRNSTTGFSATDRTHLSSNYTATQSPKGFIPTTEPVRFAPIGMLSFKAAFVGAIPSARRVPIRKESCFFHKDCYPQGRPPPSFHQRLTLPFMRTRKPTQYPLAHDQYSPRRRNGTNKM